MIALYLSLGLLGLAAIDPIGIGIMPVLLAQRQPYKRSLVFLAGSFTSLMIMGLLFAKGLGRIVLRFERQHAWFVPSAETVGAVILLGIAAAVFIQIKTGRAAVDPSGRTRRWLELDTWHLFVLGMLLVAVQSVIDVVFVLAMVKAGTGDFSDIVLTGAIAIYSIMALALQLAVVAAFYLAPPGLKNKTLQKVRSLLAAYSYQILALVSLLLSCILFWLAAVRR